MTDNYLFLTWDQLQICIFDDLISNLQFWSIFLYIRKYQTQAAGGWGGEGRGHLFKTRPRIPGVYLNPAFIRRPVFTQGYLHHFGQR